MLLCGKCQKISKLLLHPNGMYTDVYSQSATEFMKAYLANCFFCAHLWDAMSEDDHLFCRLIPSLRIECVMCVPSNSEGKYVPVDTIRLEFRWPGEGPQKNIKTFLLFGSGYESHSQCMCCDSF
jgi:hypothetical protein